MGGSKDKASGGMDRAKGKLQHAWGELTNNDTYIVRGKANKRKGKALTVTARLKNALSALRD